MSREMIINLSIIIFVVAALFFMWKSGYRKQVKKILLVLVVQAEQAFGSKTGQIKFSEVYRRLPILVTLFFSEQDITNMINEAVNYFEEILKKDPEIKDQIFY